MFVLQTNAKRETTTNVLFLLSVLSRSLVDHSREKGESQASPFVAARPFRTTRRQSPRNNINRTTRRTNERKMKIKKQREKISDHEQKQKARRKAMNQSTFIFSNIDKTRLSIIFFLTGSFHNSIEINVNIDSMVRIKLFSFEIILLSFVFDSFPQFNENFDKKFEKVFSFFSNFTQRRRTENWENKMFPSRLIFIGILRSATAALIQ